MKKEINMPVSFLEWVSRKGYLRLAEHAGHKWFKMGDPKTYTSLELYDLFEKEIEEQIRQNDLEEYNKQLEYEAKKFGGI